MSSTPPRQGTPDASGSPDAFASELPPPPPVEEAHRQVPPFGRRGVFAVLLTVVLCDVTIYRGQGFAGYALLFFGGPLLLLAGSFRPHRRLGFWIVGIMLAVLAAKMLWCGSELLVGAGFVLLVAFAMTVSGLCPYVLEVVVFASQTILAGYGGLIRCWRSVNKMSPVATIRGRWLNVALPLLAFVVFSVLFILANPDLLAQFGESMELLLNTLRDWIIGFSPDLTEVLFCLGALWITVGLLRPVMSRTLLEETSRDAPSATEATGTAPQAFLYSAFRNTLVTVIVLFAIYLVFEFKTLWFRVFPEGFHYSGYAHEGAAWLTLALALATGILSLVFRGRILQDPRLRTLRGLAWVWSLENLILAASVFNRLHIYVGFNGMTRMRIVAILGMLAVVVGFILVLWKIAFGRDFVWLMRRHLWTLALTVYVFALLPVDTIVVSYNVRRILSGDPATSVQISVHPISSEGVLLLEPLLDCGDETIREGVRAMLAERLDEAESLARRRRDRGWTTFQVSDHIVLERLRAASGQWAEYTDHRKRDMTLKRFHDYAYQWY